MEAFVASLPYIFGGSSLIGVVLFLIFFKQNKALKNNEVKKSDVDVESSKLQNDMAQIDIGDRYLNGVIEATERLKSYQTDYKNGIESLTENINEIKDDVKEIKKEQTMMSLYLNGKYQEFKDNLTNNIFND